MSARKSPYPHRHAEPYGALRLQLMPQFEEGHLGGWWAPYSRDLTLEAAHLVDGFPIGRGRIDRLVYAPPDWEVVAPEIYTRHGRIKVGFLPASRGSGLVLIRVTGAGIVLLGVSWAGEEPVAQE
ncbi:MAG TPA: DUF5994 family protein [Nocardioides sp.]|nr:DUF5994 family protein [Nocardioides sp.]